MDQKIQHSGAASRRDFVRRAAGLAGGLAAANRGQAEPAPLPKVRFGKHEITRLIIGSNPLYGFAHFNNLYSQTMREWMTQDRRLETLRRCEQHGINTWQVHYSAQSMEDFKRYRAEGGKMLLLLLGDFELTTNPKLIPEVAKLGPIGIAYHGNRTDTRFRAGEMHVVREWLKVVRDAGVMVGVSTHNPAVVDYVEGQNWDVDYFQTCLYRITRTAEEMRQQYGEATLGEIFMEKDPERMCRMIRQTRKPCVAFKLLAAGRSIESPAKVEQAFRFAYSNIKPGDAAIVGMFPRYRDEVRENTALARRICGA